MSRSCDVVRAINEWDWLITEAHGFAARLNSTFGPGWYVEATYSTKDGKALLVAMKENV